MAAPHRRSSASFDARTSMPLSTPLSLSDDDYDLEHAGVADGFRPADVVANQPRPLSTQHRDLSHGRRTPRPRPSSTTKPNRSSFTLRHDGAMGPVASMTATTSSASSNSSDPPPTRASSVSTDGPFVRAESPYRGPEGPSHPYQMYDQEAQLPRTASIATTSTIQVPERSYQGPNGPTHPYGMYPQNTALEADTDSIQAAPDVVGFPGRSGEYHRRLGPDGEEVADIIGPDGHTEQLPPYTKYPDEAFARKARAAAVPALAPGAGGIGLATRNPEFSSREDLHTAPSRRSMRSVMSDSSNHTNIGAPSPSEKPQLKRWQKVARRRICGIVPIWAICLAGVAVVVITIILLAVMFTLWLKHSPNRNGLNNNGRGPSYTKSTPTAITMTTTFDASPYTSIPTNIPQLPTGTFALPISTPSAAPSTCLDERERNAWSCGISPGLPYQMQVGSIGGTSISSDKEISLGLGNNSIPFVLYGAQPPVLPRPQLMTLALDNYDTQRGPAWFFQTLYDKVVIIPEDGLPGPISKRAAKRHDRNKFPEFMRKEVAPPGAGPWPGDHPWFCYWNNTLLEAFIYVNETSIFGAQASATQALPSPGATPSSTATATATPLSSYPKIVKIQERRISSEEQTSKPYCVQHYITDDGAAKPFTGGTGSPITVYLNETEPPIIQPLVGRSAENIGLEAYSLALKELDAFAARQRASSASCGCVWVAL